VTPDSILLNKYNVPVPRYTSYPTVPYWNESECSSNWPEVFQKSFEEADSRKGISLYLHLPFCESLCTYCGCNKKITGNHNVEEAYIHAIHHEWQLYSGYMSNTPVIREIHLGGGTPTFFSPNNLRRLLLPILDEVTVHEKHDFSFEGHPNNTSVEHLQVLYELGFRRVSFGVQDHDPEVQRIINRVQPFENVQRGIENARRIGYSSVNFDLIYGLPRQTVQSIGKTIKETIALRPDRIAFYSYAHVPWTSKGQRLFDENDLPSANEKISMYSEGKTLLLNAGYHEIGMDHFAVSGDALFEAQRNGALYRNFMGYTVHNTDILLGLGVSAISSLPGAYTQNDKSLHNYYAGINEMRLPITKGHLLTQEDREFGDYIRNIICTSYTNWHPHNTAAISKYVLPALKALEADGLVEPGASFVRVTERGRNFIRNICSAFDLHMARRKIDANKKIFSTSV
jgi:oxygen-independent coproporphyrinogen-3 oxidase